MACPKSVLLALMALQFRRYPNAQVSSSTKVIPHAQRSSPWAAPITGWDRTVLSRFSRLRNIDDPAERSWAAESITALFAHENVAVTPELKEFLWSALTNLASAPPAGTHAHRSFDPFAIEHAEIRTDALHAGRSVRPAAGCCRGQARALRRAVLRDRKADARGERRLPVLTYLFHRLEERFEGRPTLLIFDEAWVYLDNPLFAARIREW